MSATESSLTCLILAAGHSRRFGSAKLLHIMPDGRALIEHTVELYQSQFDDVRVVTRADDHIMHQRLALTGARLITHDHATDGMSQSIVAGIEALEPKLGVLIALGDMPFVASATVRGMAKILRTDNIVVPRCNAQAGNPVAFGARYFAALLDLKGDIGARQLIKAQSSHVDYLDVDDRGIFQDVDTPEDVLKYV